MSIVVESSPPAVPEIRRLYTYDELVAEMAETNQPCELWEGELVMSPAPSVFLQKIAFRFQRALHDWVEVNKLGEVVGAPVDMVLSPHGAVQPDVAFISRERLAISQRAIMGPADLVAEVVSLGGRSRDRIEKRDLLFSGVTCLWLLLSGAGCGSLGGAASGTFASVTIENRSPQEIAVAAAKVFGAEGYMDGPSRAGQLVFQKAASRATTLSQSGLYATQQGAQTVNRVKLEIVPLSGGSSYRLQCQAYIVRDAGALLEDEVRLSGLRSGPYQSLLNKVKKQLK